jgi:peroxiredoxin Q/BCP
VLGVSNDDLPLLTRFAESLKLPFPLLSDADGKVAQAWGVAVEENGKVDHAARVSFVIDAKGRVRKVFEGKEALDPEPAVTVVGLCAAH